MQKYKKTRMRLTDYIRLGRLSIKARKKSTKNTVFGMSFGLILLVPMIFFAVAFYTDLSTQVNSIRTASECVVELKNINDSSPSTAYKESNGNSGWQEGLSAYSKYDDLIEMDGVEDYILSEYCGMPFMQGWIDGEILLTFNTDDEYNINPYNTNVQNNEDNKQGYDGMNYLRIIFPDESTVELFTDAELADYKKATNRSNPLINLCNDGFTRSSSGKNEIILSEILLQEWGIDKEDIAGEVISISYPEFQLGGNLPSSRFKIDNDDDPDNDLIFPQQADPNYQTYLCYEYTVVGIIDADYYNLPGKDAESHMWVTAASVYYEDGSEDYVPISYSLTANNDGTDSFITFEDDIALVLEKNIDDQYMLLLETYVNKYVETYTDNKSEFYLANMKLSLQFADYETVATALTEMKTILDSAYRDMPLTEFSSKVCNVVYTQFDMIDKIGKIIIIIFSSIGCIIFITNMLNLLNTVRYSVESRKNYIGVMRAIGAKSRIIPKMYIFEMLIIFFKTFIYTAIFSSGISYAIKYGLDYAFSLLGNLLNFQVNFIYYPVALGGAMSLTVFLGVFFAYISSKFMSYQPILKTLYDEK